MTDTNLPKELVRLANGCLNNKIKTDELCQKIKSILLSNNYILDEVLEACTEYTSNFEIVEMLQKISEQISYSKVIQGKDGINYYSNLFAIPIVFVKKEGTLIESIENFQPELEEIAWHLKKSKVFDHECQIHIHNQLISPEQLMVLDYNYIYSFLNEMSNFCFDRPYNIINPPQFESDTCKENTLYVRYLFGVRVFKEEATRLTAEQEYDVLSDFNSKTVSLLSKILDGFNVSIIGVDELYPSIQVGLEFYTSLSRKIEIEQHLVSNNITAQYCEALINIDLNDIEDSLIEITSIINDEVIGTAKIYPLKYQEPKELIGAIAEELAEIGFDMENVTIKAGDNTYQIDFFLEFENEIEIASIVNNFFDNPNIEK